MSNLDAIAVSKMYVIPNLNEAQIEPVFLHTHTKGLVARTISCVFF
jgi:hypothetical protein